MQMQPAIKQYYAYTKWQASADRTVQALHQTSAFIQKIALPNPNPNPLQ